MWHTPGRIYNEKNPLDAIKVAKKINKPLTIVGPVLDKIYFKSIIESEIGGLISYAGHITSSSLDDIYSRSEIILATALWDEPFGLVYVEAMRSGVKVFGYENAILETLQFAPEKTIVQKGNMKQLVEKIIQFSDLIGD